MRLVHDCCEFAHKMTAFCAGFWWEIECVHMKAWVKDAIIILRHTTVNSHLFDFRAIRMSSEKVSMSLGKFFSTLFTYSTFTSDDIIKKDRKNNQQRGKKGGIARKVGIYCVSLFELFQFRARSSRKVLATRKAVKSPRIQQRLSVWFRNLWM